MCRYVASGVAAAEAAAMVQTAAHPTGDAGGPAPDRTAVELADALETFDEPRAQGLLDGLLTTRTLDAVLTDVLIPYLHAVGGRWRRGEISIGQEHFATAVVRGRLGALACGWDRGVGPRALLACPPGELHDLGLLMFGLALRERGFRIVYLGCNTPVEMIAEAADAAEARAVVVSAVTAVRFRRVQRSEEHTSELQSHVNLVCRL